MKQAIMLRQYFKEHFARKPKIQSICSAFTSGHPIIYGWLHWPRGYHLCILNAYMEDEDIDNTQ
ncbi:MAG TPA: hypothetical protein VIY48_17720 [Candidatus Paceibacterota bacterium]